MPDGQKDKGQPKNVNQKVQKHKYMNNHERGILQNRQRCERFIEKIGVEYKTLENTNLRFRKKRERKSVLRIRGEIEETDTDMQGKNDIYFRQSSYFKTFFHFILWEEKEKLNQTELN